MHLLHSRIVHSPDCAFAAFHYLKDQQRHRQSVGHTVRTTHKRDETMAILNTIHAPKSFTTGGVTGGSGGGGQPVTTGAKTTGAKTTGAKTTSAKTTLHLDTTLTP